MIQKEITNKIEQEFLKNGKVTFLNFGTIRLRKRKSMTRVLNGKTLIIPARLVPEFKASKTLIKKIWK